MSAPDSQPQALLHQLRPPSRRTQAALAAPRCRHLKVSGARCGSPALRGRDYCHFHQQYRDCHALDLPFIEDAHSIQLAIMQVLRALSTGLAGYKDAALMLYGLQTASANLRLMREEAALEAKSAVEQPEDDECSEEQGAAALLACVSQMTRSPDDGDHPIPPNPVLLSAAAPTLTASTVTKTRS